MIERSRFKLKIRDHLHAPEAKRNYNQQHFSAAASRYDFATRAMSLGRDRTWKRALVAALPNLQAPHCIDLACGTGDIAFLLAEKYPDGEILGLDLTEPMLTIARQRNRCPAVSFHPADMVATGRPAASTDIVTGSYAIRNAPELRLALDEIHRLLKPGGHAALLDFSKPCNPWLQRLQYAVLRGWCGLWGLLLHGNSEIHAYIAASLVTYPDRRQLHLMIQESGFNLEKSRYFYFGMLELLVLKKPR